VFGPHPRSYQVGINRKVKRLARKSALSYKAKDKGIVVVENFSYKEPKTQAIKKLIDVLDFAQDHVLLITENNEPNIYLSAKNLYKIEVRTGTDFSTYDVMRAEKIIMQEGAISRVKEVLGK
jgi:large subunit ribosomal protein L4